MSFTDSSSWPISTSRLLSDFSQAVCDSPRSFSVSALTPSASCRFLSAWSIAACASAIAALMAAMAAAFCAACWLAPASVALHDSWCSLFSLGREGGGGIKHRPTIIKYVSNYASHHEW